MEQVNEPTCYANVGASVKIKVDWSKLIDDSQIDWRAILPQSLDVENAVTGWSIGAPFTELVIGSIAGVIQVAGEQGLLEWIMSS